MITFNQDVPFEPAGERITRKILAHDGTMMAVEVHFEQGAIGALHSHPHEQISYVLSGKFRLTIGDEVAELSVGDTYHTAPNLPHGVTALEAGVLLDIFTPQREDFLANKKG